MALYDTGVPELKLNVHDEFCTGEYMRLGKDM